MNTDRHVEKMAMLDHVSVSWLFSDCNTSCGIVSATNSKKIAVVREI